jgi:hypothetical protein
MDLESKENYAVVFSDKTCMYALDNPYTKTAFEEFVIVNELASFEEKEAEQNDTAQDMVAK